MMRYRRRLKDGSYRRLRVVCEPLRGSRRNDRALVSKFPPTSMIMRGRRSTAEQQATIGADVIDAVLVTVLSFDFSGNHYYASKRYLSKLAAVELSRTSMRLPGTRVHPEDFPEMFKRVSMALVTGQVFVNRFCRRNIRHGALSLDGGAATVADAYGAIVQWRR